MSRLYFPHAETVLRYQATKKADQLNKRQLVLRTAYFLDDSGDSEKAEQSFSDCIKLGIDVLGPEDLWNLEISDILGAVMVNRGRHAELALAKIGSELRTFSA